MFQPYRDISRWAWMRHGPPTAPFPILLQIQRVKPPDQRWLILNHNMAHLSTIREDMLWERKHPYRDTWIACKCIPPNVSNPARSRTLMYGAVVKLIVVWITCYDLVTNLPHSRRPSRKWNWRVGSGASECVNLASTRWINAIIGRTWGGENPFKACKAKQGPWLIWPIYGWCTSVRVH